MPSAEATLLPSENDLDTVDQRFIHPVQIPENHLAQHIGLEMLRVSSERNWPAQELPPKGFGLISLPQTTRRLFVIATPDNEAFARCPRYCRGLIQVPILLPFIVESHVSILPLGTFGLPPNGRTLGRYPFHHKGRTRPMSSVACEGSHMKDFGGGWFK